MRMVVQWSIHIYIIIYLHIYNETYISRHFQHMVGSWNMMKHVAVFPWKSRSKLRMKTCNLLGGFSPSQRSRSVGIIMIPKMDKKQRISETTKQMSLKKADPNIRPPGAVKQPIITTMQLSRLTPLQSTYGAIGFWQPWQGATIRGKSYVVWHIRVHGTVHIILINFVQREKKREREKERRREKDRGSKRASARACERASVGGREGGRDGGEGHRMRVRAWASERAREGGREERDTEWEWEWKWEWEAIEICSLLISLGSLVISWGGMFSCNSTDAMPISGCHGVQRTKHVGFVGPSSPTAGQETYS